VNHAGFPALANPRRDDLAVLQPGFATIHIAILMRGKRAGAVLIGRNSGNIVHIGSTAAFSARREGHCLLRQQEFALRGT